MSEEKQACRGLARGWAWRSSGPTMLLCAAGDKDIQAVAGVGQSGLYALYPDKSLTMLDGELHRSTPRDGENAQVAGQREAVEALWAGGGFGDACPPLALDHADLQCIAEGLHDNHVSETGVRWANMNKRTRSNRPTPRESSASTDAGELAELLDGIANDIELVTELRYERQRSSPIQRVARAVKLLLGERDDLCESRDGALRQRDAAETDRDLAQEAARTLCEKQAKHHVAALLEYERQLARADRLWISGEERETALRVRVTELEADVRRLQAQIEASAELHREDRKRADDLANVPG